MENLCSLLCSESIHIENELKHSSGHDLHVANNALTTEGSSFLSSSNPSFDSHSNIGSPRGFSSSSRGRSQYRGTRGGRFTNYRGGRFNNRSQGRHSFYDSSGSGCQICGKLSHLAFDC